MFDPAVLDAVSQGFWAVAGDPSLWGLILAGALLGMVVGILPGFGPPAAMALLFPLAYMLRPLPAISLLAGIFYGAKYGGAVTSILTGIPGEPDAVATTLEGVPLARAGKARPALLAAAVASFIGGMLATLGMVLLAPMLTSIALYFSPRGQLLLLVGALGLVAFLGQGKALKNLAMVFVGLVLALPGLDAIHGTERLTLGLWSLTGGFDLTALLLGFFGLGDILDALLRPAPEASVVMGESPTRERNAPGQGGAAPFHAVGAFFSAVRGAFIGFLTGLVPSGAGMTATFASYALEKRVGRDRAFFGKGAWGGLMGPEAANNAAAMASFAPLLLLGLPTNPVSAALLNTLTVGGVVPGPGLPSAQPVFYWGLIFSLTLGNILLLALCLGLAGFWAKLALTPWRLLWPFILVICLAGSLVGSGGITGPIQCLAFGFVAVFLKRFGFSPSPLVLAFVLGPRLEICLAQTLMGGF